MAEKQTYLTGLSNESLFSLGYKRCSVCGEIKPIDAFNKKSRSKDGHRPECRECQSKVKVYYDLTHKEQKADYQRRYLSIAENMAHHKELEKRWNERKKLGLTGHRKEKEMKATKKRDVVKDFEYYRRKTYNLTSQVNKLKKQLELIDGENLTDQLLKAWYDIDKKKEAIETQKAELEGIYQMNLIQTIKFYFKNHRATQVA